MAKTMSGNIVSININVFSFALTKLQPTGSGEMLNGVKCFNTETKQEITKNRYEV